MARLASSQALKLKWPGEFIQRRPGLAAPIVFMILTLLVFGDTLFDSTVAVGSASAGDLQFQWFGWRKFGFDELRNGNLALWNPHIYGGTPYFAGFQSALLYPPNWLHLVLPVGLGTNWIHALHVFAAGYFTSMWCRYRGIGIPASILAGVMFMFCGPYFTHIYGGHLPHIAIMAWAPLLFCAIDQLKNAEIVRASLLGTFVMAMISFAGHPQYVYFTGMAVAIYVLANLPGFKRIRHAFIGSTIIVAGGVAISAVQWLTGLDAASEFVRSKGMDYDFSSMISFPPENLLTAIAPEIFGAFTLRDYVVMPKAVSLLEAYFGRTYVWESTIFMSLSGLILAMYAAVAMPFRKSRIMLLMIALCTVLALGAHTPLHKFLYDYLPGFSNFRGASKFGYLVGLFVSLLAAYGFDLLSRARRTSLLTLTIAAILLVLTLSLSWMVSASASNGLEGGWHRFLSTIYESGKEGGELYINASLLNNEVFVVSTGKTTAHALFGSAVVLAVIVAILLLGRIKVVAKYAIGSLLILAMIELSTFAASTLAVSEFPPKLPYAWNKTISALPEDARVLAMNRRSNMGMWFGHNDVWGEDPGVLARYAELLAYSQGTNPDTIRQYMTFRQTHFNIFPLIRLGAILFDDIRQPFIPTPPPMSLAQLIPSAKVLKSRDEILQALNPNSFDPRKEVFLETEPSIKPAGAVDPGTVKIVKQSTDYIELIANVNENAILLITNAYSSGWRVTAMETTDQSNYEIIPGNWALQAIPLSTGRHFLRLEYRPRAFTIGKWISITSVILYFTALMIVVWRKQTDRRLTATISQ